MEHPLVPLVEDVDVVPVLVRAAAPAAQATKFVAHSDAQVDLRKAANEPKRRLPNTSLPLPARTLFVSSLWEE